MHDDFPRIGHHFGPPPEPPHVEILRRLEMLRMEVSELKAAIERVLSRIDTDGQPSGK